MNFLRWLFGVEKEKSPVEKKNNSPHVTMVKAAAMSTPHGDPVHALVYQLSAEEAGARRAAAKELRKLGTAAVEPLIAALKTNDDALRGAAARLLGRIGDTRAIEPLLDVALGFESKPLRADADKALLAIGEPALKPIIEGLKRPGVNALASAADLLGRIGDPRAIKPLAAALHYAPDYRRSYVVKALGQLGGEEASVALVDALQYKESRSAAVRWLVRFGGVSVEPLIAALENPDPAVRKAAAGALQKLAANEDLEAALRERATTALAKVDLTTKPVRKKPTKKRAAKPKPKRAAKPTPKPAKSPSAAQGRGYNFLIIVGKAPGETPAYQRALEGLVQGIASAGDGRLSGEARIKTFTGDSLPDPGSTVGIESYVRAMQMRTGVGFLAFEYEFRRSGGYDFMVVYMRQ
jgi:HEAT repeat protein